jgi:hypothetical protein
MTSRKVLSDLSLEVFAEVFGHRQVEGVAAVRVLVSKLFHFFSPALTAAEIS